ncbi:MAG TPA: hypothetical protein VH234_03890 [Candidatus Saccharimonadales bacterium]|jgi:hypothetical protein|nr:hypothetical protein [Candidatus Saccharimonadales bacterium]
MAQHSRPKNLQANEAVKAVFHIRQLGEEDPELAVEQAYRIENPVVRANALIEAGRISRLAGPLYAARSAIESVKLHSMTRGDKLSRLALTAVGIDNTLAARTAREIPSTVFRTECQQLVSVNMAGHMIRQIEDESYLQEFHRYPEIVTGAFYASVGLPSYFGKPGVHNYVRLSLGTTRDILPTDRFDVVRHGGRALEALVDSEPYFTDMISTDSEPRYSPYYRKSSRL